MLCKKMIIVYSEIYKNKNKENLRAECKVNKC
jgi:hypothetical protein